MNRQRNPRPQPPVYQDAVNIHAGQLQNIYRQQLPQLMGHCIPRMPSLNISMYPSCGGQEYHEGNGIPSGLNPPSPSVSSMTSGQYLACTCPDNWPPWPGLQEWPPHTRPETVQKSYFSPGTEASMTDTSNRSVAPLNMGCRLPVPPSNVQYRPLPHLSMPYNRTFPPGTRLYNMPLHRPPLPPPYDKPRFPGEGTATKINTVPRWVKVPEDANLIEASQTNSNSSSSPTMEKSIESRGPAVSFIVPGVPMSTHRQPCSNNTSPMAAHREPYSNNPSPISAPSQLYSNNPNPISGVYNGSGDRPWAAELALRFDQSQSDERSVKMDHHVPAQSKEPAMPFISSCPPGYRHMTPVPTSDFPSYYLPNRPESQERNFGPDRITVQRNGENGPPAIQGPDLSLVQPSCDGTSIPPVTPEGNSDSTGLVISQVYSLAVDPQGDGPQSVNPCEAPFSVWNYTMPQHFPEQRHPPTQAGLNGNPTASTGQTVKKKRNRKETNQARDQGLQSGMKTVTPSMSLATPLGTGFSDPTLNCTVKSKGRIRWKSSGWECTCLVNEPESQSRKRRKSDGSTVENMIMCKIHRKNRMELLARDTDEHVSLLVDRLLKPEGRGPAVANEEGETQPGVGVISLTQTNIDSISLLRQKELESESSAPSSSPPGDILLNVTDTNKEVCPECSCHHGPRLHATQLQNRCPVLHQLLFKSSPSKNKGTVPNERKKKKRKKKKKNNAVAKKGMSGHAGDVIQRNFSRGISGEVSSIPEMSEGEPVYSSVMDSSMRLRLIKVGMELEKVIGAGKGNKSRPSDKLCEAVDISTILASPEHRAIPTSNRNPSNTSGISRVTQSIEVGEKEIIDHADEHCVADVTSTSAKDLVENHLAEADSTNLDMIEAPNTDDAKICNALSSHGDTIGSGSTTKQAISNGTSKAEKTRHTCSIGHASRTQDYVSLASTLGIHTCESTCNIFEALNNSISDIDTTGTSKAITSMSECLETGSANVQNPGIAKQNGAAGSAPKFVRTENESGDCTIKESKVGSSSTSDVWASIGTEGASRDGSIGGGMKSATSRASMASIGVEDNAGVGRAVIKMGDTSETDTCSSSDGMDQMKCMLTAGGDRIASRASSTGLIVRKPGSTSLGLSEADEKVDFGRLTIPLGQPIIPEFALGEENTMNSLVPGEDRTGCSPRTEPSRSAEIDQNVNHRTEKVRQPLSSPRVELDVMDDNFEQFDQFGFGRPYIPLLPLSPVDGSMSNNLGATTYPQSMVACPSGLQEKLASDGSEVEAVNTETEQEPSGDSSPSSLADPFTRKKQSKNVISETIYLNKGPLDVCIQKFHGHKLPCLKLPAGSFFLTTQLRDEVFSKINRNRFHTVRARDLMIAPLKLGRSLVSDFNAASRNKGINVKMQGGLPFLPYLLSIEDAQRLYTYFFGLKNCGLAKGKETRNTQSQSHQCETYMDDSHSKAVVEAGTDLVCGVMLRYIDRGGVRLYPRLDLCCEMIIASRLVQIAMMKSLDTSIPKLDWHLVRDGEAQALNRLTNRRNIWVDIDVGNCLITQATLGPILHLHCAESHIEDCFQPLMVNCNPRMPKAKPIQMLVKGGMTDVFGSNIRFVLTSQGKEYVLSDVCEAFGEAEVVCWIKDQDLQIRQCSPNEIQFLQNLSGYSEFKSDVVSLVTIPCLFELSRGQSNGTERATIVQNGGHDDDDEGQQATDCDEIDENHTANPSDPGDLSSGVAMKRWGPPLDDENSSLAFRRMERKILKRRKLGSINKDGGGIDRHMESDYRIGRFVNDDDIQMCVRPTETIACASDDVDLTSLDTNGVSLDFTDVPISSGLLSADYEPMPTTVCHSQGLACEQQGHLMRGLYKGKEDSPCVGRTNPEQESIKSVERLKDIRVITQYSLEPGSCDR